MSKRTLEESLNKKDDLSLQQNPPKRQKIVHKTVQKTVHKTVQKTVHKTVHKTMHKTSYNKQDRKERKWSALEMCCIMELIVHEDVCKLYQQNPEIDVSLFNVQDWQEISDWMTLYFSKSQSVWFMNNIKPKIPYKPNEIKQCAINTISIHNNGTLPKTLDKLLTICSKIKKLFHQNAVKILDKNKVSANHRFKQIMQTKLKNAVQISAAVHHSKPAIINKIPPIPLPIITQQSKQQIKPQKVMKTVATNNVNMSINKPHVHKLTKTDENTCKKHLMSMLKKLSKYSDTTQATMRKKLEDKYNKQFQQITQQYAKISKVKLKTEENKLLQQKATDWKQYKQTIAKKVRDSWQANVIKLQHKFSTVVTVIPMVKIEYLQQNPNDETIKLLLATQIKGIINTHNSNTNANVNAVSNSNNNNNNNNMVMNTKRPFK